MLHQSWRTRVPVSGRDAFCRTVAVSPERQVQCTQRKEKTGEKTVLEGEVEFKLTTLAGCQPSFQEKTFSSIIFQSNIKGIEVFAVSINKILFCALVQMKWCSFKDSEVNTGICSRGQVKCVCLQGWLVNFLDSINFKSTYSSYRTCWLSLLQEWTETWGIGVQVLHLL